MTYDRDPREIRQPPAPNYKTLASTYRARDPAEKLSEFSRAKLTALELLERDLGAAARLADDAFQDKREEIYTIERRIRELDRASTQTEHNIGILAAERENLAVAKKGKAALEEQRRQRGEKVAPLRLLLRSLDEYLSAASGPLPDAPRPNMELRKGESLADAVARFRQDGQEARVALQDAMDAPITSGAAKAIARRYIEDLAQTGRPNVLATLEGRRPPKFAMRMGRSIHALGDGGAILTGMGDDVADVEATLCWLFKDRLTSAVERAIDEDADDASALSDEERAARIAQAKADILAAERLEEAAIELAAENGVIIARRPDADPRAMLGLADSCREPRE